MNWKSGSDKTITFYEIIQQIKSHHQKNGQVFVGTDSLANRKGCTFSTSIVLLGADEQRGARFFYSKEKFPDYKGQSFYNRILKEVEKSINIAIKITEVCPNANLEIHLDVSPEGKNERTSQLSNMLMGYAKGSGFKCKVKPDSFAASTVADKYTK